MVVPAPIFLPLLTTGALLWLAIRRAPGDHLNPGTILVGFYFLMSISSLFFVDSLAPSFVMNVSWATMAGYSLLLILSLLPALMIVRPNPRHVASHTIVQPILDWSAPLVAFSYLYLIPYALASLGQGFSATRLALTVSKELTLPESPLTTIAVAAACYYPVFSILFFSALIRRLGSVRELVGVAWVCLPIVHAAAFGARDGFIWVGQSALVGYWIFASALQTKARRRAKFIIAAVCVSGIAYMALATKDRFGESKGGYASGTLSYFGAQPYVFSETVDRLKSFYGAANRFPVLAPLFGSDFVERTEPFQWSFGTFLTDFYAVSGWTSAVALTIVLSSATIGALHLCKGRSALAYALVVALYTQFIVQGAFYYRLGNRAGNLYHLTMLALIVAILLFFPDKVLIGRAPSKKPIPVRRATPDAMPGRPIK